MRLLILGGTSEASALAREIAGRRDLDPVLSLAGRTRNPAPPPIPFRIGGFGGIDGLKAYLAESRTHAVIDATHPFAAQMSCNAAAACRDTATPLAVLTRPPWRPLPDDRWACVPDMEAAVEALGAAPRTAFLTIGGVQLAAFARAPQHRYVVRSIDHPASLALLPSHRLLLARGPFTVEDEIALMRREQIDILVTKNSGAAATAAKLTAARTLGIEVVMIERPAPEPVPTFESVSDILAWIEAHRPRP